MKSMAVEVEKGKKKMRREREREREGKKDKIDSIQKTMGFGIANKYNVYMGGY